MSLLIRKRGFFSNCILMLMKRKTKTFSTKSFSLDYKTDFVEKFTLTESGCLFQLLRLDFIHEEGLETLKEFDRIIVCYHIREVSNSNAQPRQTNKKWFRNNYHQPKMIQFYPILLSALRKKIFRDRDNFDRCQLKKII